MVEGIFVIANEGTLARPKCSALQGNAHRRALFRQAQWRVWLSLHQHLLSWQQRHWWGRCRFKNGDTDKAFQTFYDILITPPGTEKIQAKPSDDEPDRQASAPIIQPADYDSGIDVQAIDSPSFYRLANEEDYLTAVVEIKQELCSPTTSVTPELLQ